MNKTKEYAARNVKIRITAAFLTVMWLAQIGTSVAVQIYIAAHFGTSPALDVYLVGITIPSALFMILASSFGIATVSYFNEVKLSFNMDEACRRVLSVGCSISGLALILSALLITFGRAIIVWLAPEFSTSNIDTATQVLQITALALPSLAFSTVIQALLQANHRFVAFSFAVIAQVGLVPILIVFGSPPSPATLAWGFNIGAWASCLILIAAVVKNDLFRIVRPNSFGIARLTVLSLPLLASAVLTHALWIAERHFAVSLGNGAVSALSYAQRIVNLFSGALAYGLTTVLFPILSERLHNFELREARILNRKALILLLAPTLLVAGVLFTGADRIIALTFQRGAFTSAATNLTSTALAMYTGLLIYNVFGAVIMKNAIAAKEGYLITLASIVLLFSFLFFAPIITARYGFAGLPLTTSLAFSLSLIILVSAMLKRHPSLYLKPTPSVGQ